MPSIFAIPHYSLYHYLQAAWSIEGSSLPPSWPQTGTIEFQDYGLQYRKGLELALKGISVHIHEREKVKRNILHELLLKILLVNF